MVLHLREPAPGNWEKAKCLGKVQKDPVTGEIDDPFFQNEDGTDEMDEAVAFCNGDIDGKICPIREECLLFALVNNEKAGVWGGMYERDRKALRKAFPWRGRKTAHPQWEWMPPGEAVKLLKPGQELADDDEAD